MAACGCAHARPRQRKKREKIQVDDGEEGENASSRWRENDAVDTLEARRYLRGSGAAEADGWTPGTTRVAPCLKKENMLGGGVEIQSVAMVLRRS